MASPREIKNEAHTGTGRTKRLLARARSPAVLGYLAAAVLLLIAVVGLGHELGRHLEALESWVAGLGPWGVLALIGLFALGTSVLLPESVLGVAAGALFGLGWGVAVSLAGNLLAAVLQYALSRRLLRARIQRTLEARPFLAAIQRAVLRDELRLQLLLRLAPLNPATISYLLGAAGVRFRGFLVACLALLPHLLLEVYLGHTGKQVARMASGGRTAEVHDAMILAGLALWIFVVVLVSRAAHRAVRQAVAESEAD